MDSLRNAMETAIQEHWKGPARPQAATGSPRVDAGSRSRGRGTDLRRGLRPAAGKSSPRSLPVPTETLARNRLVAALPESRERQAYCLLQAAVMQRLAHGGRVVGVTGPCHGSGKTLTTANLAISLAIDAHRPTIVIDFNLHAPRIHELFDFVPETGVEDCLFNGVPISDALISPGIDLVAVLAAQGKCENVDQVLRSCYLDTILGAIKASYPDTTILIDLPSVATASDAHAFEALVDGILLVIEDGVTRERDYRRALAYFSERKLIGTVLNRARSRT
jgi:Mrp family chromosome partitioning ATPase